MPQNSYEFAASEWHYNVHDSRCPHDSWIESIYIEELAQGERKEVRDEIKIVINLLGAFHNGSIKLTYLKVKSYNLAKAGNANAQKTGHGDWLVDEIRLGYRGLVIHEVEFSNSGKFIVECKDIIYQWLPFNGAAESF
jgi:hypothetical protein